MDHATARRIHTQRAEVLNRLADQGERNGVRILVDHRTGEHVATSASDPTRCYHVDTERGCTCKGFAYWGRCQHHSLLLAELGQIPDPEPDPVDVVLSVRPLEAQYVRDRVLHPLLPAGALAPRRVA